MDELDEIIGFLNKPQKFELPPLKNSSLKFIQEAKNIQQKFRYLSFKPWSGDLTISLSGVKEIIKEEI